MRVEDLVDAGLQSLECELSQATAQHDTERVTTGLKLLEQFWSQSVALHHADAIDQIEADDFVLHRSERRGHPQG